MLGTFARGSAYLRLYLLLLHFITHSYILHTSLLISFQLTLVHGSVYRTAVKPCTLYGFTVHVLRLSSDL